MTCQNHSELQTISVAFYGISQICTVVALKQKIDPYQLLDSCRKAILIWDKSMRWKSGEMAQLEWEVQIHAFPKLHVQVFWFLHFPQKWNVPKIVINVTCCYFLFWIIIRTICRKVGKSLGVRLNVYLCIPVLYLVWWKASELSIEAEYNSNIPQNSAL